MEKEITSYLIKMQSLREAVKHKNYWLMILRLIFKLIFKGRCVLVPVVEKMWSY